MEVMTMLPLSAMRRSTLTTMNADVESRPEVGSSRNRRMGSWMMSVPMETLRRSPPETPRWPSSPMMVLAAARRPSWSMSACTRARFLAAQSERGRRKSAAKESVSVTVSMGNSRSSCMTYADMDLRMLPVSGSPLSVTEPLSASREMRLARASMSVDLPEPLAPITARISPSLASPETPASSALVRGACASGAAVTRSDRRCTGRQSPPPP
uniref:Uncharacterized protein n=1 Tax=Triticum urartu TaxID=4572 RepID=A0A8R7TYC8_TRIUA